MVERTPLLQREIQYGVCRGDKAVGAWREIAERCHELVIETAPLGPPLCRTSIHMPLVIAPRHASSMEQHHGARPSKSMFTSRVSCPRRSFFRNNAEALSLCCFWSDMPPQLEIDIGPLQIQARKAFVCIVPSTDTMAMTTSSNPTP